MAELVDSPPNAYAGFFQRRVVRSVQHWQNFVAENQADTPALERDQAQILRAISFALTSEAAWPAARELIETYASYMERRGYWETWHDILTQAVESAGQFNDTAGQVTLMALLTRLLQRQSQFKEAIYYYRRVIRLARQTGNRFEEARACSNLGYLYTDSMGRWWRAEILGCHALTTFKELDSAHGQAHTNNHLGLLYTRQKEWELAEAHLEEACTLWQTMDDTHSLINGFENLGMLHSEMGYPEKALNYLNQALDHAELAGADTELGIIWNNMGLAYQQEGDLAKAEQYVKQAEKMFRQYSNTAGLARVWHSLGTIYFDQRKLGKAKKHLEESLAVFSSLSSTNGQIDTLLDIIGVELASKNNDLARLRLAELEEILLKSNSGKLQNAQIEQLKKYRRTLTNMSV